MTGVRGFKLHDECCLVVSDYIHEVIAEWSRKMKPNLGISISTFSEMELVVLWVEIFILLFIYFTILALALS
jgi:hypothetical protein